MKYRYSFFIIAMMSINVILFVSCSKTTSKVSPSPATPVTPGTPIKSYNYYVATIQTKTESKAELLSEFPSDFPVDVESLIPNISVKAVSIKYKTKDAHGNAVEASGLITYPSSGSIKGVIIGQHATLTANANVPTSLMKTTESILSLLGYAVIAPDYIGYGTTRNLVHPYIHYESTGLATVDMLLASREYFDSMKLTLPTTAIDVIGYSQGGYAAMAFEKMAETNYANNITIGRVFAGGGPYDLNATYQAMITLDITGAAATIPLLVLGLNDADNLNLDLNQAFQGRLLANYKAWILSKQFEVYEIDDSIGSNRISDFIAPELFDVSNENTKKLLASFKKNSLIDGWTPKAKVFLTQAKLDDIVPPINATNAYNAFKARGANITLTNLPGGHVDVVSTFYLNILQELSK